MTNMISVGQCKNEKDEKYKNNIQRAIDEISCINKKFTIKKGDDNFEYETKSSAHCLESALERTTLDNTISITIDIIEKDSPQLNPLMILPYDALNRCSSYRKCRYSSI